MSFNTYTIAAKTINPSLATNKVLRNTYFLLSLTLIFSSTTAFYGLTTNARPTGFFTIIGMFGLLFLTQHLRNSKWGLVSTFAFTGFMGYTLAPLLNLYLHNFPNGGTLIMTSLAGTGAIFLALSSYVLVTRKNFSYLGGFLFAAIIVAFLLSLLGFFFNTSMLQIFISGAFMLLCSGLILFHTSQIIYGGENNYIMATISLYIAIFNIFVSLLSILGFFAGGNRN
jgi:modulator of FtsH protease